MLLTSNGSCYVGECSVPTAIPEQAGDSKMDCPSTPSNSVKNINKKMFMSRKPSGPNSPLGSLSLSPCHSLKRESAWGRKTLVTRLPSTHPPSLTNVRKCYLIRVLPWVENCCMWIIFPMHGVRLYIVSAVRQLGCSKCAVIMTWFKWPAWW